MTSRRTLLGAGAALALAATPDTARPAPRETQPATAFGTVGDGRSDDSAALQRALDATFAPDSRNPFLVIPPGTYRVSRPLRIDFRGDQTRPCGIVAHGARIVSQIDDGRPVLSIASGATVRFLLIEGLDVQGNGREGHGLAIDCDDKAHYLYNFCLRDLTIQNCGGDGLRLLGNVFEGQIINSYFRKNAGNGATFAHGLSGGILSAIHVFGAVFGDNGGHGAALVHHCYDVAFHGCYFLLNARFGLVAENGVTLLSNCGFENNHEAAGDFARGDAGIDLRGFATLIGCTAYSMFNQTRLLRAYVVGRLVMIGCSGDGDARARGAGLASLAGRKDASAVAIGCSGTIDYRDGFDGVEIGNAAGGARFPSDWRSPNLLRIGEHRLWVDGRGRLRAKNGRPAADDDGGVVGQA